MILKLVDGCLCPINSSVLYILCYLFCTFIVAATRIKCREIVRLKLKFHAAFFVLVIESSKRTNLARILFLLLHPIMQSRQYSSCSVSNHISETSLLRQIYVLVSSFF